MATTTNLALLLLDESQDKAEIVVNEAIQILDALLFGLPSAVTNTPPGSPVNNELHLVGTSPTGVFVGHSNELAIYLDGAWRFYALPSFLWSTTEKLWPAMRESENLYTKVVNIAAGPGSGLTVSTAHGASLDLNRPVTIEFYAQDGTTAYHGPTFVDALSFQAYSVHVDATNVVWKSTFDMTSFVGRVRLIYAK